MLEILVIEDEVDLIEEYKILLESNKHIVTTEINGELGLTTYFSKLDEDPNSIPYDVVVLDYQLPGKNLKRHGIKCLYDK